MLPMNLYLITIYSIFEKLHCSKFSMRNLIFTLPFPTCIFFLELHIFVHTHTHTPSLRLIALNFICDSIFCIRAILSYSRYLSSMLFTVHHFTALLPYKERYSTVLACECPLVLFHSMKTKE